MPPSFCLLRSRLFVVWSLILASIVAWVLFTGHYVFGWKSLYFASVDSEWVPYSLSVDSHRTRSQSRGTTPVLSVRWDEKFSLLLRPSAPVHEPVSLRAFRQRGGTLERWGAPFQPLNNGGFILNARPADAPALGDGTWELIFLIGRSDALPHNPYVFSDGPGGAGWQVLRLRVDVDGPPPESILQSPVRTRRTPSYIENGTPNRSSLPSSLPCGVDIMPSVPPQLTKENSLLCVQTIYVWASTLKSPEKDEIVDALKNLLVAMRLPGEKLEPGSRSASETPDDDVTAPLKPATRRSDEKLEPGTRSADEKPKKDAPTVDEKLEKGARSASEAAGQGARKVVAIGESRGARGKPEMLEPGSRSATDNGTTRTRSA